MKPMTTIVAVGLTAGAGYGQAFSLGLFEGEWHNDTFGSTGSASILFEDLGGGNLGLTADLGGNVFGIGDPDPVSMTGTLAGDDFTLDAVVGHPLYGDVSGTIDAAGAASFDLVNAAGGSFSLVTLRGTAIGDSISLAYEIFTPSDAENPFAVGTIVATLVPSPGSLVLLGVGGLMVVRRRR